jgi:uncharacterized protein YndB with AHSA1/START domain
MQAGPAPLKDKADPMTQDTKVEARVRRTFNHSPDDVFDAFLTTDRIGQWMFGRSVRDEEIVRLTLDPKVGGGFSFVVRRQGQEIDHVGKFLEIDRPRRLVFTWGIAGEKDESRVSVEITPKGRGSELTLSHEMSAEWVDFVKRSEEAWTKMLSALSRALG